MYIESIEFIRKQKLRIKQTIHHTQSS